MALTLPLTHVNVNLHKFSKQHPLCHKSHILLKNNSQSQQVEWESFGNYVKMI